MFSFAGKICACVGTVTSVSALSIADKNDSGDLVACAESKEAAPAVYAVPVEKKIPQENCRVLREMRIFGTTRVAILDFRICC